MRRFVGALAIAFLALAGTANANQITGFGQLGSANTFIATDNGDGTTSLDVFALVGITNIISGPLDPNAVFEFHADSTDAASLFGGVLVTQSFVGTFTLHNLADTFTYLSGTFGASLLIGGNGGTGSLFTGNTAGLAPLTLATDLPIILASPESFQLSLSNLNPPLFIDNSGNSPTVGSFTASFTGTADAAEVSAVPEPGSLLLLGTGLFGFAGTVNRKLKRN